jgi:YbbR domain-containing protein
MIQFIKEKILENWILKISAILLALILWLFIRGESGTVTMVNAPVEVQVPPQMEISSGLPSTVQVTMRGTSQQLTCFIDLQNAKEGENKITLTEDNIKAPKGFRVEVSQVKPSQVVLKLERTVSKTVPILVPVRGDVARGFEIYAKVPNPPVATITGPRSHIEPVKDVSTEIITLNGQEEDANFQVGLNFRDGAIRSALPNSVWVEIQVGPRRKTFTVLRVPLKIDAKVYAVKPKQISVLVMAPESLKEDLVPDNFSAAVDERSLKDAEFPVKLKPEIGFIEKWKGIVMVTGTKPSEVTVRRIESESSRQ